MKNEPIRIELPTIYGMKTVNAFLFKEPEPLLIDCGEYSPEVWEALKKGLADNGLTIHDIKKVYISHTHIDHVGMAGKIATETGAEIWVNEKSVLAVTKYKESTEAVKQLAIGTIGKLLGKVEPETPMHAFVTSSGKSPSEMWKDIPDDRLNIYKIGDILNFGNEDWKVIYMPGHSDTQVIYFQEEAKKILSTDMLLAVTPVPFFELKDGLTGERIKGLPIMLKSYETLKNLDFDVAYPGHYETIKDPKALIDKQVNHIHKRKEDCLNHIKGGVSDFQTLYGLMYSRVSITAIPMLIGYLDLLVDEGKINWIEDKKSITLEAITLNV